MDWFHEIAKQQGPEVQGVIHVGANDGGEYDLYASHGVRHQIWIEPQAGPYAKLLARLPAAREIRTFNVACGNRNGTARMYLLAGNDGMSSSLLRPARHLEYYPHLPPDGETEVPIRRIDDLLHEQGVDVARYNLMVLDVQGYELECLKGGVETITRGMDYIIAEVNREELYAACALLEEVDAWLLERGFNRVSSEWCGAARDSWGEALYVHDSRHTRPSGRI
jgi:FkbM family methyltransferase